MANFAALGMTGEAAVRAWAAFAQEPEATVAWT